MPSTEFVTSGGHLALDLINTRPLGRDGEIEERLARVADLDAWLAAFASDLPRPRRLSREILEAVRALREAVAEAVSALTEGSPVPHRSLDLLTELQRRSPSYRALTVVDGQLEAEVARIGPARDALLASLAAAATDLLVSERSDRVRRCEAPDCSVSFLAINPRRRWCSTDTCGNRVRVARHYQRHRA